MLISGLKGLSTVEPIHWDSYIQGNTSIQGKQTLVKKKYYDISFVFVTHIERTPLFQEHMYWRVSAEWRYGSTVLLSSIFI